MAVIAHTTLTGAGERDATITTLGASDTFVFAAGKNQVLLLNNVTVGALTPLIDGAGGTTVAVPGIGSVSVADGYQLASVAAAGYVVIPLDSINKYLQGVITITGATGMEATILGY